MHIVGERKDKLVTRAHLTPWGKNGSSKCLGSNPSSTWGFLGKWFILSLPPYKITCKMEILLVFACQRVVMRIKWDMHIKCLSFKTQIRLTFSMVFCGSHGMCTPASGILFTKLQCHYFICLSNMVNWFKLLLFLTDIRRHTV